MEKIKLNKTEKIILESFKDYHKFHCTVHGLFLHKDDFINKCPYCNKEYKELNIENFK